jgi:hypothetical protein
MEKEKWGGGGRLRGKGKIRGCVLSVKKQQLFLPAKNTNLFLVLNNWRDAGGEM